MKKIFCTCIAITFLQTSYAQDTLKLINGKEKIVHVNYETGEAVVYQKYKKGSSGELKEKKYHKYKTSLYQVAYHKDYQQRVDAPNNRITQVYKVDSIEGDYFTVGEMRNFLDGKIQGRKHHKAGWFFVGGFLCGAAGGAYNPIVGVAVPAGYTWGMSSFVLKRSKHADDMSRFSNLHFNAGYIESAKRKQVKYSAIGSLLGYAATVATLGILGTKLPSVKELLGQGSE